MECRPQGFRKDAEAPAGNRAPEPGLRYRGPYETVETR